LAVAAACCAALLTDPPGQPFSPAVPPPFRPATPALNNTKRMRTVKQEV